MPGKTRTPPTKRGRGTSTFAGNEAPQRASAGEMMSAGIVGPPPLAAPAAQPAAPAEPSETNVEAPAASPSPQPAVPSTPAVPAAASAQVGAPDRTSPRPGPTAPAAVAPPAPRPSADDEFRILEPSAYLNQQAAPPVEAAAALPSVQEEVSAAAGTASQSVPSVQMFLGRSAVGDDTEPEDWAASTAHAASSTQTTISLRASLKNRTSKFADDHGWSGADAVLAAVNWADTMLPDLVIREREGARHPALKNTRFNLERSTRKRKTLDPKTKFSLYADTEQIAELDALVDKATAALIGLKRPKTNRSELASAVLPIFMDMIEEQERLEAEARKAAREAKQASASSGSKTEPAGS